MRPSQDDVFTLVFSSTEKSLGQFLALKIYKAEKERQDKMQGKKNQYFNYGLIWTHAKRSRDVHYAHWGKSLKVCKHRKPRTMFVKGRLRESNLSVLLEGVRTTHLFSIYLIKFSCFDKAEDSRSLLNILDAK